MRSLKSLRDEDLLRRLGQLVSRARRVEADVVAHIGEVELRRLYAHEACSSMFEYCRRVLRLRENEAYLRITVARAARANPALLDMLSDGRLHLSGIARLAPHLTPENSDEVLRRASGLSHRGIKDLVAELQPRPDVASSLRKLPQRSGPGRVAAVQLGAHRVESNTLKPAGHSIDSPFEEVEPTTDPTAVTSGATQAGLPSVVEPRPPAPVIEPLAPGRYLVRFTAGAELRDKLERLQALMRHSVPDGDLARIIDIAITEKLQHVEARRFGRVKKPRRSLADTDTAPSSRNIPAAVRRRVYARDGGRCTYRNTRGRRCARRFDLEFHHKHPFGRAGDHDPANVTLMCKAHNTLLAEQDYGKDVMDRFRIATSHAGVPVDAYGARIAVQPRGLSPGQRLVD